MRARNTPARSGRSGASRGAAGLALDCVKTQEREPPRMAQCVAGGGAARRKQQHLPVWPHEAHRIPWPAGSRAARRASTRSEAMMGCCRTEGILRLLGLG